MIFAIFVALINFSHASDFIGFDVVESRQGDIVSYRNWKEKNTKRNIEFIDWTNPIRQQGAVGSCQSFGFLGIIENQVSILQGASIDLSERYQLYSNFIEFGALGSSPAQIARFPEMFESLGTLPEILYPYSVIDQNAAVFAVDSAQGLQNETEPAILKAIAGRTGPDRAQVLQQPEFFGALPSGGTPIELPVFASHLNDERRLRHVKSISSQITSPCYSTTTAKSGISLTPAEFASHCLEFKVSDWDVTNEFDATAKRMRSNACNNEAELDQVVEATLNARKEALRLLLSRLENKNAAMLAMSVPLTIEGKKSSLWDAETNEVHAGHAVVALGYLTAQDLRLPANQKVGALGSGLFDQLSAQYDKSYQTPPSSLSEVDLRDYRISSAFGRKVLAEQGIFFVRNSWGDIPGLGGYQAITFDFMMAHMMLTMSTRSLGLDMSAPDSMIQKTTLNSVKLRTELRNIFCPKK